jgi:23S rRNA (cytosine1962-C5)-methyltransferase
MNLSESGTVTLRKTEARRLVDGHPWVFSNEVAAVEGAPAAGDLVTVLRTGGKFLGRGFYHPHSLIAVRLLSLDPGERVDGALFYRRLTAAREYRERIYPRASACRVVHGEGDFLPGLVVDRYADCLVLQTFSAGMDRLRDELAGMLQDLFAARAVVERDESPLRDLEELPRRTGVLRGAVDGPVEVDEAGVRMQVDLLAGQKTGGFLDQRDNRAVVRRLAGGARALDVYCGDGAFSLQAAAGGAVEVLGIDASASAIERARANAARNRLDDRCAFREAGALPALRAMRAERQAYDLVILDPPSFTRARKQVPQARRAYGELHREAMRLLRRGGLLATASCSHHIQEDTFLQIVTRSAREMGRRLRWVHRGDQAPDHPVLPEVPETRYLKFGLFQVL